MMSLRQKLIKEIKAMVLATLYFATWIGVMIVIKELILAEYRIQFHGLSLAVIGALVLAKVVLILEHIPLGAWIRNQPALVDVILRTAVYALGVLVVLLLEKAFNGRVNTICVSGALLVYNVLSVVRRQLGEKGLIRLFMSPLINEASVKQLNPSEP